MISKKPPTEADWEPWARKDLWSQNELCQLCAGLLPGTPNRTDNEQVLIQAATEAIARGTLSKTLAFVSRDDTDTAAVMYGTARHYVPVVAAEWAAPRFDAFPASLLDAARKRAPKAALLRADTRTNLLRIIRALNERAAMDAPTVAQMIESLGFTGPGDDTVRKVLDESKALIPDSAPR